MNDMTKDILYLSACALHGTSADREYLRNLDLNALYTGAMAHGLTSILCTALTAANAFEGRESGILENYQSAMLGTIRKNMLLDAEREKICGYMETQGIWYMPLKGVILQSYYPDYGMREMSDNDILIDPSQMAKMREYMLSRGYTLEGFGDAIHDEYIKAPTYCFELHSALVGNAHPPKLISYYENVKDRLIPDSAEGFGYHFSDEDFYLFMIAHAYKHYVHAGTGLRNLLDVYVFLDKKTALNWEYIQTELGKMQVQDFEKQLRELSLSILSEPEAIKEMAIDENQKELLDFLFHSGVHGTIENYVRNTVAKDADGAEGNFTMRVKYYFRRIFPSMEWYRMKQPFLYRFKVLIPFFLVYRILWAILNRREKIQAELSALKKMGAKK